MELYSISGITDVRRVSVLGACEQHMFISMWNVWSYIRLVALLTFTVCRFWVRVSNICLLICVTCGAT